MNKWRHIREALEEWARRKGDRPDRFDCYDIAISWGLDCEEVWQVAKRLYW